MISSELDVRGQGEEKGNGFKGFAKGKGYDLELNGRYDYKGYESHKGDPYDRKGKDGKGGKDFRPKGDGKGKDFKGKGDGKGKKGERKGDGKGKGLEKGKGKEKGKKGERKGDGKGKGRRRGGNSIVGQLAPEANTETKRQCAEDFDFEESAQKFDKARETREGGVFGGV